MKRFFKVLFLLVIFPVQEGIAQDTREWKDILKGFDKIVGLESTPLFNGTEYTESHRMINENHKFFMSFDFLPGSIVYEGQPFYNLHLKYNIFEDLVIVNIENLDGSTIFQLHQEKIDSFSIAFHHFVHIKRDISEDIQEGFYELLEEEGNLSLLKKYRLRLSQLLDENFAYYEFDHLEPKYILKYGEEFIVLNSRRNLSRVFQEIKKDIKEYYRKERDLRKNDPDLFYTNLLPILNSSLTLKN